MCCILGNIEHWVLAIFISRDMKCIEMTDNKKVGDQKWNDGKFIKNKIFETYQKMLRLHIINSRCPENLLSPVIIGFETDIKFDNWSRALGCNDLYITSLFPEQVNRHLVISVPNLKGNYPYFVVKFHDGN